MAYATSSQLRQRVGATSSDSNDWLDQLIAAASELVDGRTRGYKAGYPAFAESASEIRYFDDDLTSGHVNIDDAQTVTAVTRGGITIDPSFYKLAPYNKGNGPYTRIMWNRGLAVGGVNTYYRDGYGVGQVGVTGTWGYCETASTPACVTEAVLKVAEFFYESSQLSPSEQGQVLVNPNSRLVADIDNLLRPVKRGVTLG